MMGNVMEWCWDWYHATWYSWSSGVNPRGPTIDSTRVIRDVAWTGYSERGRVAHRAKSWMGAAHANTDELGFRTVLPVSE